MPKPLEFAEINNEALRMRRRRLGMSQEHVAKRAGISRSYLAELETGAKTNPRRSVVESLATVLSCSFGELT